MELTRISLLIYKNTGKVSYSSPVNVQGKDNINGFLLWGMNRHT